MTVRTSLLQNAPAGVPAEEWRLMTARFLPAATNGLTPFTGVLPGPAGYIGEVTLLGPESIRVNPAVWVIAGTQAGTQGAYVVVNDAAVERPILARDATLSRIDLLVVSVRDTAYTPNEGANDPDVRVIAGTPAVSGAVAPAVPPNAAVLGTITVPPGSGTVTFTPTVLARQVAVGGIQPLRSGGPSTNGSYDGQIRDHYTLGLQRWNATTSAWDPVLIDRIRLAATPDLTLSSTTHAFQLGPDSGYNLAADANQIQARNAGAPAYLGINVEESGAGVRGNVDIGFASFMGDTAAADGSQYHAAVLERVRVTSVTDAQARNDDNSGTPSHLHPLQIGPDNAQHVIIDTNEGMARTALTGQTSAIPGGTGGGKVAPFAWHGLQVDEPVLDSEPVRRGTLNGNSNLANLTGWQNFSLASRWTTYAGGPGAKWIYMNGTVWFSMGIVSATAWPANTNIVTWSTTYRPRYDQYFFAVTNGQPFGEVRIEASTGAMTVTTAYAGTNGPLSISGSFIPNVVF